MNKEEIISVVKEYVKNECFNDSTGHDWWHIQRVYNNAMLINKKENADEFIITIIVLMHDLCDRTPIKYQLTIPSYYNTKLLKDKSYDFFYLKDELYKIGIIEMKTPYGNKIRVYNLERTICDIIRNKTRIEIALFTDTMKRYAERKYRKI